MSEEDITIIVLLFAKTMSEVVEPLTCIVGPVKSSLLSLAVPHTIRPLPFIDRAIEHLCRFFLLSGGGADGCR